MKKYIVLTKYSYCSDSGYYTPYYLADESCNYEYSHLRDQAKEFTSLPEAIKAKSCYQISSVLISDSDLGWFYDRFNSR